VSPGGPGGPGLPIAPLANKITFGADSISMSTVGGGLILTLTGSSILTDMFAISSSDIYRTPHTSLHDGARI
jgi:hypothetical protein